MDVPVRQPKSWKDCPGIYIGLLLLSGGLAVRSSRVQEIWDGLTKCGEPAGRDFQDRGSELK